MAETQERSDAQELRDAIENLGGYLSENTRYLEQLGALDELNAKITERIEAQG